MHGTKNKMRDEIAGHLEALRAKTGTLTGGTLPKKGPIQVPRRARTSIAHAFPAAPEGEGTPGAERASTSPAGAATDAAGAPAEGVQGEQ
jgi:hypothetical protein